MNTIKRTLNLGKIALTGKTKRNEVSLELTIGTEGTASVQRDWDTLAEVKGGVRISICGHVWNATTRTKLATGGQIIDVICTYFDHDRRVMRICALWDRWHLNDMKAGTRVQTAYLDGYKAALFNAGSVLKGAEAVAQVETFRRLFQTNYHKTASGILKAAGLLVDRGYKYGSAWLIEQPPAQVIEELQELFS